MANGGGAVVGNTGKRLPSKLQWSRKTIFLASGLNLAGELFLPSQSPRLLSTTHGDTVCCLFPTQIGFAVSQLNSPQPKPSPLGLSPLTHFLTTFASASNPSPNSVLPPIYLYSDPTHAFPHFLLKSEHISFQNGYNILQSVTLQSVQVPACSKSKNLTHRWPGLQQGRHCMSSGFFEGRSSELVLKKKMQAQLGTLPIPYY